MNVYEKIAEQQKGKENTDRCSGAYGADRKRGGC